MSDPAAVGASRNDAQISADAVVASGWRRPLPRAVTSLFVLLVVVSPLALHTSGTNGYALSWDDFPLVHDAISWERTESSLWKPFNNHFFPLFRIWTWALVRGAGRLSAVPSAMWMGWLTALTASLLILYEFVQRETGCTASGLIAVLVAGMTSSYYLGGGLYATTQIFWAVSFTLVALLSLQSMAGRFSWPAFLLAVAAVFLAPAWRAEGVLAGPIAGLYVLVSRRGDLARVRRSAVASGVVLASVAMIGLERLVCGPELVRSPGTVWGAMLTDFRPALGAYLTARVSAEHLWFWNFGLRNALTWEQFAACFSGLVLFVGWYARRAGHRAMAACGVAWMLASYWMVYTIRGNLGLDALRTSSWYLIVPQFGWALFLGAGLFGGTALRDRSLSVGDSLKIVAIGLALFLLNRPVVRNLDRSALAGRQLGELKRLEAVEELGKEMEVDVAALRAAIGPLVMSESLRFDGLTLLRLPASRRVWPADELRRRFEGIAVAGWASEPATP